MRSTFAQAVVLLACCVLALGNGQGQEPKPVTPPKLDGHALFSEKGCAHCHGPNAAGTTDAPNLHGIGKRMPSDAMRHQIIEGGKSMPAFGDALTPEETDALIIWLHTLKPSPSGKSGTRRRAP